MPKRDQWSFDFLGLDVLRKDQCMIGLARSASPTIRAYQLAVLGMQGGTL
jgi:hypothetical protein